MVPRKSFLGWEAYYYNSREYFAFEGKLLLRGTTHSTWDQILLVKIGKCIGFCVYRRSYLLWSPIIVPLIHAPIVGGTHHDLTLLELQSRFGDKPV